MEINKKVLIHLSLIEGVGPVALNRIIASNSWKEGALALLYTVSADYFVRQCGLSQRLSQGIVEGLASASLIEREIERVNKKGSDIVTLLCDDYPASLKTIHVPPPILYVHGDRSLLAKSSSIAIVGSRKADNYAKRVIDMLVPPLVAHDFTIVSGGALGADSFAHEAALACGGKTVIVLGSGLERLYPPINKRLFDRVVHDGGVLVTPFSMMTSPAPGHFPARNRIIAGLSRGCVVVQADVQSGARITALFALEQGREVFAVPGPIDHPLSAGCHLLLREGATLISSAEDILEQLGYERKAEENKLSESSLVRETQHSVVTRNISFATPDHEKVYAACRDPHSLDQLMETTALSMVELQSILFDLQIEALIQQDSIGRWSAV